ncbi:MAG: transglycosylase SLT domain-containing protein [Nitrospinae bacterium]|nr:transglycosylase SLT domain-containing protein [Nitrospinota bacterium]
MSARLKKNALRWAFALLLGFALFAPSGSPAFAENDEIKNADGPLPVAYPPKRFDGYDRKSPSFDTTIGTLANAGTAGIAEANVQVAGVSNPAQSVVFPEPAVLKPNVDFWVDVYTKYTEKQAIIHDSEDLEIRYEVVDLSQVFGRASHRYISRQLTQRKKFYSGILASLAKSNGECATPDECRVAALFGNGKDGGRYRAAMDNLRAQYGLANRFRDGLSTSGRYMEEMRKIFASHGLPMDLVALPHVESSFNVAAYSRVGAAGIWQFMRSTGRHFMKINNSVDERRDPLHATDAAARFLKSNYSEIGNWPLTVISYNHGKNGILHAQRIHGNDVEAIIRNYHGPAFGFASRNFYTEFLAARKIMLNPEKYFGQVDFKSPLRYSTVKVDGNQARRLAANYGVGTIAELNPGLHKQVLNGKRQLPYGYVLRVPEKGGPELASFTTHSELAATLPEILRQAPAPSAFGEPPSATYSLRETSGGGDADTPENMMVYVTKRGDTLSSVAKKFNTTVADLKDTNDLRRHRLRAGRKLFVPRPTAAPVEEIRAALPVKPAVVTAKKETVPAQPAPVAAVYEPGKIAAVPIPPLDSFKIDVATAGVGLVRVKSEELLGHYATWACVGVRDILALNHWKKNKRLAVGQIVNVPLTKVSKERFEESRVKYHQKMLDGFLSAFSISGVDNLVLKRGQTIWNISENSGDTPMWLLSMYNQDKKLDRLRPGETVRVPLVHKKVS